jgi:hypothetical protein
LDNTIVMNNNAEIFTLSRNITFWKEAVWNDIYIYIYIYIYRMFTVQAYQT